jgi:hypothetical protein
MGCAAAKPISFRRNDVIDEKTQAALSQIGREGPATSGRTRWLNPSYRLNAPLVRDIFAFAYSPGISPSGETTNMAIRGHDTHAHVLYAHGLRIRLQPGLWH